MGEPGNMQRSTSAGSGRFDAFTEAVPLSLSSMAHASIPLEEGVLDGLKQVLSHTLLSCVNYARIVHPPHQWSFRDLCTSRFAWRAVRGRDFNPRDLPFPLEKMKFRHQYSRNAWIYLRPAVPADLTAERELELLGEAGWSHQTGILGRVSLLYVSTEPLTQGEMDGTEVEDMPATLLYKVVVEYRSLPATGNQQAVQAEELSMLSFGGSVDDDVKYGALASLYDEHAKYVLEIYSVRGKKYKFDLMDSTLSDGSVPTLPSSRDGDPFVKSLCLTVTDHSEKQEEKNDLYAITRIHLTLEGKPRKGNNLENLPRFDYMTSNIVSCFLRLNPVPAAAVSASPSGHSLLLDPELAGHVYINGRFVTKWGEDNRIGSHGVALFGVDLHSVPFWHGRIVDYEVMKVAVGQLWQELVVDARLLDLKLRRVLLFRLMKGRDRPVVDDEDDLYDDDGDDDDSSPDVNVDCLESLVLADTKYDPVGIAAKALATNFAEEFGKNAFPCLAHETEWVKKTLPDREPVVVPQRLINVLRRGGYFDTQKTADLAWFTASRPVQDGIEADVINGALQFLEAAGCGDVDSENVVFISTPMADNVISRDVVCRYNDMTAQYFVHEDFMKMNPAEYVGEKAEGADPTRIKAYLLGMYIAKAHPYGKHLARYVVRNKL